MNFNYTDQQKKEFLEKNGYTVETIDYQEYQDGRRSSEDEIHDHQIILAYKGEMSKELEKHLTYEYKTPFSFHYYQQETLSGAFDNLFSSKLLILLSNIDTDDNKLLHILFQ